MRKSYYTNGYTNDHDPTYYRDSYEQARRPRRVCRRVPDTGGRDHMAWLGKAGRARRGTAWLGAAWQGWLGMAGSARQGASGLVMAGRGSVWHGRRGRAGPGWVRPGVAGQGRARQAWQGERNRSR